MRQLWAPWRLEYMQGADAQQDCIFCRAPSEDDHEGLVVRRGEHAFALLNRYPYASGHLMIAPFRHEGEFADLSTDEAVEIHRLASGALGERTERRCGQPVHLDRFLGGELAELALVAERGDHQVTGRIRELVQEDERPLAAVDDEALPVGPGGGPAEDARLVLVGGLDVLEAPGRPELPHSQRLWRKNAIKPNESMRLIPMIAKNTASDEVSGSPPPGSPMFIP